MGSQKAGVLSVSREYSGFLERISRFVFAFASGQKFDRDFDRDLRKYREFIKDFPKGWEDLSRAEYCFGRIFSSAVLIRKFIRSFRDELLTADVEICKGFIEQAWEYVLFSVEKTDDTLVYAVDSLSEEKFLLESANAAQLDGKGARLLWTLVFFNGECYQSYGIINYFRGLCARDFEYYSRLIHSACYHINGVHGIMQRYPVRFMLLFAFCEIPFVVHGNEKIVMCASRNVIPGFEEDSVEGYSSKSESGDIVKFSYISSNDFMRAGTLYVHRKSGEVTLVTTTFERYRELYNRFPCDFGESPDIYASVLMVTAAERILNVRFPGSDYDELFDTDDETDDSAG